MALRSLEGFRVECARRLTGMRPRQVKGKRVYPKSAEVPKKSNLKLVRHYIHPEALPHCLRHCIIPPYPGGVQGDGAAKRFLPPHILVGSAHGGTGRGGLRSLQARRLLWVQQGSNWRQWHRRRATVRWYRRPSATPGKGADGTENLCWRVCREGAVSDSWECAL